MASAWTLTQSVCLGDCNSESKTLHLVLPQLLEVEKRLEKESVYCDGVDIRRLLQEWMEESEKLASRAEIGRQTCCYPEDSICETIKEVKKATYCAERIYGIREYLSVG